MFADRQTPHRHCAPLRYTNFSHAHFVAWHVIIIITSCAARWPPQYAPAPAYRRPTCLPMCVPNLKIVAFSVCEILRGSQNFEIGSRTPGHANLGAKLWSMGKNCPRPMCVPNLKIVAFSVCEILRVFQNFKIGSHTPGHAHLGANLRSGSKNCPRPMCVPNLKGVALFVCEILAHFTAVH